MSRVLEPRRLVEYRRRVNDPAYLTHALNHVAGVLADTLLPDTSLARGMARERDYSGYFGDPRLFN